MAWLKQNRKRLALLAGAILALVCPQLDPPWRAPCDLLAALSGLSCSN